MFEINEYYQDAEDNCYHITEEHILIFNNGRFIPLLNPQNFLLQAKSGLLKPVRLDHVFFSGGYYLTE